MKRMDKKNPGEFEVVRIKEDQVLQHKAEGWVLCAKKFWKTWSRTIR
jgi:hypothetical protein